MLAFKKSQGKKERIHLQLTHNGSSKPGHGSGFKGRSSTNAK